MLLSFSFDEERGSYVIICDYTGFEGNAVRVSDNRKTWLCGVYYLLSCACPNLDSIRRGVIVIAECEGYDWTKHVDVASLRIFWNELVEAYPIRFRKIKYFHNGMFLNLAISMTKRFVPKGSISVIETGCKVDQRLDAMYLVPTVEKANARLLRALEHTWEQRCLNVESYRLPPLA